MRLHYFTIIPVSETFVSAESLLDFVFIFYSHWGLVFILLTRFAKNTFDHLIFNFALPFWDHCALLC